MDHIRYFFQVGLNETPLAQIKENRMNHPKLLILLSVLLLTTFAVQGQQILIRAGRLIDTNQKTVKKNVDILVEGNRIIKVGKNLESASASIIDLSNKTVLPGRQSFIKQILIAPWKPLKRQSKY